MSVSEVCTSTIFAVDILSQLKALLPLKQRGSSLKQADFWLVCLDRTLNFSENVEISYKLAAINQMFSLIQWKRSMCSRRNLHGYEASRETLVRKL